MPSTPPYSDEILGSVDFKWYDAQPGAKLILPNKTIDEPNIDTVKGIAAVFNQKVPVWDKAIKAWNAWTPPS